MRLFPRCTKSSGHKDKPNKVLPKNHGFAHYIRDYLFSRQDYDLVDISQSSPAVLSRESDLIPAPDLVFQSVLTSRQIYIKPGYQPQGSTDVIEWCDSSQIKQYRAIAKKTPVYIVIGLGGIECSPEKVFLVPLDRIQSPTFHRSFLSNFEIPTLCR
jgi:hypothetical protein